MQVTTENITIENLLFTQDKAQLEEVYIPIPVVNEEEESILNILFYNANALLYWKIISIIYERKVIVEEYDILEDKTMGVISKFGGKQ